MSPRPRVLVVDDEELVLGAFVRSFRRDLDIVTTTDPSAAMDLLRAHEVDVAAVDYSMPAMNGIELLERVAEEHPRVARVLVTAHWELPEVRGALRAGLARCVVAKPWTRAELLACLASVLSIASIL